MRRTGLACLLAVSSLTAAPPPLVDGPYPRAFFFRAAEGASRGGRTPYDPWSAEFSRLSGIMGKVLDEEVPGTSDSNIDYFTRFKHDHPDQAVFLHYNGNSRDPRVAAAFFPGHWLYWTGPLVTADVGPEDTVLHVADPGAFRTGIGRYDDRNDDLLLARLVDGKVDFQHAEHLELVSVDGGAKTITVRRGCFDTSALSYQAGQAVVQVHLYEGPWGRRSNLLWAYNWRPDCPRDAQGRTATDVFLAEFAELFGQGGRLASFDGVEFDVLGWEKLGRRGSQGIDSDGDNQPDSGYLDGVNVYGRGVWELSERLHQALPDKLWMADGWSVHNQRAVGALNGIESEGWPTLSDGEVVDWSGGVNRHRYWTWFAREPRFSYVNHKYNVRDEFRRSPLHCGRLVQAACVMMDSAFCYSLPPSGGRPLPIWDELIAGEENQVGWLGMPLGEPQLLATKGRDLLAGADLSRPADGDEPAVTVRDGVTSVTPPPGSTGLAVRLARLELPDRDLTVRCRLRSETLPGMPDGVPRYVTLALEPAGEILSPSTLRTGMTLRGAADAELDPATGAIARYYASYRAGDEAHEAVFAHPPWRDGALGRTWWERIVPVPAGATLRFFTALPERPGKSDGVTCLITASEAGGEPRELYREHLPVHVWQAHEVDLGALAGHTVTLRFTVDPGPADNTVADGLAWGEVHLAVPEQVAADLTEPGGFTAGMQLNGQAEAALDPATGATVRYEREAAVAGASHEAMFTHPPYQGVQGTTWWERTADVPQGGVLRFLTALSDTAKAETDGVTYTVTATPADGGPPVEVFTELRADRFWRPAAADLADLAGHRVTLRFAVDPGPNDNTNADQAFWGEVRLTAGARVAKPRSNLTPGEIQTWAGPEWFESGFYFRDSGPDTADLVLRAEGGQPLELTDLHAYVAADVQVRQFEHGLVIANPGSRWATVELGGKYRRFKGTADQDPRYNDGSVCGATVTVPRRDAMFLRSME